jgi:hypothetical protein
MWPKHRPESHRGRPDHYGERQEHPQTPRDEQEEAEDCKYQRQHHERTRIDPEVGKPREEGHAQKRQGQK